MLAANGEVITSFYEENRAPVAGDQIAEVMKQAMVAIEDARFYDHGGLDVQGTLRALVTNVAAGEVQEGGSTLTQQLVKQTLLQAADTPARSGTPATEQTLGRKLREARLALALEDTYSKDELLTRYLNIVYFGQNAYGVQPAARAFFGVDAAALTLTQAALLAGLVHSPADDDPFTNPEGATVRRNQVLTRMAAQGYITPARGGRGRGRPARPRARRPPRAAAACEASVGAVRLRLRAEVPDPDARHQPARARPRRLRHPDDARPRPAARRRRRRAEHPAAGRHPGGHLHRRRAGHRPPAGDERQPDLRLRPQRPDAGVLQPQRGAEPRRRLDLQGVRRRGRAGPRLLHHVHADGAEPVRLPRLQEGRRARTRSATPAPTGRRWT